MAKYQVPENLIDQLQILLRKEASLESFNPNDPSIPPLPTLEEAIAGIGTSDHQLRCEHCRGELLRGSESIICVYCGQRQQQESPPQPIALKSTLGFGWLLLSLNLDGSENVEPPIGGSQSNGGQGSRKNEIALSDFLNLELKWPDESNRFGMINEAQPAGERSLSSVGVDLNELFPEGSRDTASCVNSEQAVTSQKIEIKETATFPVQKSLNLFETQSSESALRSNEGENDESSSGWEAEFQFAVPDAGHEHLQSLEATKSPPVDNASHVDSIQGHFEVEKSANILSSHAHPRSDLTDDTLDVNFALPSQSKQSEGNVLIEDVGEVVGSGDASSGFNWSLGDQQKTVSADPSHVESRVDDSFDQLNDFRILTEVKNNHCKPSTATQSGTENSDLDISDGWKELTGSVGAESNPPKANILIGPDDDSLDVWNDFTVSINAGNVELKTKGSPVYQQEKQHGVGDSMLGRNDFAFLNEAQQDRQDIHADAPQNKTFNPDDSVGLLGTGISIAVLDDQLLGSGAKSPVIGTTTETDDSFNLWNDFKSSTVGTQPVTSVTGADNKMSGKDDATLDTLSDFASIGASKNEEQISTEKAIDGSFASWNDLTELTGVSVSKPISNDASFGEWKYFSTVTHTDQYQSSGKIAAESQSVLEDDGSFQDHISTGKASESLEIMKDNSPFDPLSDFRHSILMPEKQLQAGGIELSENKITDDDNDFFSGWSGSFVRSSKPPDNQLNSNGVMGHDGNLISANDDTFVAWNDSTSSGNVSVNQSLSGSGNASLGEEAVKHDDIFDSWNVFTSSSNVQAGIDTMLPNESMPEISLFSTNTNFQGVEGNSLLQQDLFGVFSEQNGCPPEAVSVPQIPDLVRAENGGAKADGLCELTTQTETSSKGTSDLKSSDAEILISEMHDLSFMLENSLSIPKSTE